MARTEAERKAQQKYLAAIRDRRYIDFNKNTDQDILAKIEAEGFAPYVKRLIREDIAREAEQAEESCAE